MSRKKFNLNINEIKDYVNVIESYSIKLICESTPEKISRDIDDDKILQCAFEGNVDFIITGDDDLLTLKNYGNTKIITPKEYLNILENI